MTITGHTRTATRLDDVDLFSPDTFVTGVPHDMFTLLRRDAPVYFHPEPGGPGFWALTRYDDVVTASRDSASYSSGIGGTLINDPTPDELASMQLMMLNMDPPRHTKLRLLVNKGFTPRMIARLEERVRWLCTGTID